MFVYEKSFKESISLCLSIEREWMLINQTLSRDIVTSDALHILDRLIYLMQVLERSDAKVKLLHELAGSYSKFDEMEEVLNHQDEVMLSTLKDSCNQVSRALTTSSRILSRKLISDPFLSKFYYRQENVYSSIHAEIWSKQSNYLVKEQMYHWLKQIENVWHAVEMILWVVRYSGSFKDINVKAGFHRENVSEDTLRLSLIRVRRKQADIFPSLSLVQHWLVVTVYQMGWKDETYQSQQIIHDVDLSIALCK
jgi:cell division FtsZ-interacting protein ZapD